jgi:hypothetical protein
MADMMDWMFEWPAQLSGGAVIEFLLDFVASDYADDAAPITSPLVCRKGSLVFVETNGATWAISGGKLVGVGSGLDYNHLKATSATISGETAHGGKAYYWRYSLLNATLRRIHFAATYQGAGNIVYPNLQGAGWALNPGPSALWIPTLSAAYNDFVELIGNYRHLVFDNDAGSGWKLRWVGPLVNTGTGTPGSVFDYFDALALYLAKIRLADLPANAYPVAGTRDLDLCVPGTGTGTSSIAAPAAGNTFVHTADCVIRFTQTTIGNDTEITFRETSYPTDYSQVYTDAAGGIYLRKYVGGSPTILGSGVGVVNGSDIRVILQDTTVKVFVDGVLKINYASLTEGLTKTAGRVKAVGGGGAIANLAAKTLDGIANVGSANHPGYGLATACLPGPLAVGDAFTHEADGIVEFGLDALPSGRIYVSFRRQDTNNKWAISFTNTANFELWEYVSGTPTYSAAVNGIATPGMPFVVVFEGSTIKGYYGTTLGWTYSSATNFQTLTSGAIDENTGKLSDLLAWPASPASAPLTPGASSINAALTAMGA